MKDYAKSIQVTIVLALAAIALLVACGGSAANPPAAATVEQTAATVEPTLAPTAEPTAIPFIPPAEWPAAEPGTITIDASLRHGPINPFVYGTNQDPAMVVTLDMLDTVNEEMGIRFVRFPAGNFGDRNIISNRDYDNFIKLTGQLGAEPNIHVRVMGRTAEDAAATVRLVNEELGHDVRYWAIGNEPELFYNHLFTAEEYAALWREFALAMKAADPDIILIGPETTQFATAALAEAGRSDVIRAREWMRVFLETNGDLVDIVSVHRYPFPMSSANPNATVEGLRPMSAEFDESIPELRAMIREITGRDLPVAVTEVNTESSRAFGQEASPDSPFAAVWLADVLGRLIRQDVDIVAQYGFSTNETRGPWGLLARKTVRPQFYTYQLYKRFGSELVHAAADAPWVSAYAALRDDGALTIMVVNLGDEAAEVPLRLVDGPAGEARVYRIDAANLVDLPALPDGREEMPPVELADGAILSLPPRSATLYVVGE